MMKAGITVAAALATLFAARAGAESCPTDLAGWGAWRERVLSRLPNLEALGDGRTELFDTCQSESSNPAMFDQLRACMSPLQRAGRAMSTLRRGASNVPIRTTNFDEVYEEAPPGSRFYRMLELPPEFDDPAFMGALAANPGDSSPPEIAAFATRYPGSALMTYQPATLAATPFNRHRIDVAYIPTPPPPAEPAFARYVHTFRNPRGGPVEITMLSIQTQDGAGNPLDPPRSYYSSFTFAGVTGQTGQTGPPASGDIMARMHAPGPEGRTDLRCTSCHRTGGMPIVAAEDTPVVSLTAGMDGAGARAFINARVRATATAQPAGFDMSGFGPPMGAEPGPESRTERFVRQCAAGVTRRRGEAAPRIPEILDAMSCGTCHASDGSAGPLTAPLGPTDFFGNRPAIMETFILSNHMPPHSDLTPLERRILFRCLSREYYGGFTDAAYGGRRTRGVFLEALSAVQCPTGPGGAAGVNDRDASTPPPVDAVDPAVADPRVRKGL